MAARYYGSLRTRKYTFEANSSDEDEDLAATHIISSGPVTVEQLTPANVIPPETPWREHPRWKPLLSTPAHNLSPTYLIPDRSRTPSRRGSFMENESVSEESPGDSTRHQRRRKERVDRPLPQATLRSIGTNMPRELTPKLKLKVQNEDLLEKIEDDRGLAVSQLTQKSSSARHLSIRSEQRSTCTHGIQHDRTNTSFAPEIPKSRATLTCMSKDSAIHQNEILSSCTPGESLQQSGTENLPSLNPLTRIYAMPWTISRMHIGSIVIWVNAELGDAQNQREMLCFGDALKIVELTSNGMAVCEQISGHGPALTRPPVGTITPRSPKNAFRGHQSATGLARTLTWGKKLRETVRYRLPRRPEIRSDNFVPGEEPPSETEKRSSTRPSIKVHLLGCVLVEELTNFCKRTQIGPPILPPEIDMEGFTIQTTQSQTELRAALDLYPMGHSVQSRYYEYPNRSVLYYIP